MEALTLRWRWGGTLRKGTQKERWEGWESVQGSVFWKRQKRVEFGRKETNHNLRCGNATCLMTYVVAGVGGL